MARVPARLKRLLVPLYNRGYWSARRAALYLDAVAHGRFERCTVCGRYATILFYRKIIPRRLEQLWGLSPCLAEALARKESSACGWCGAKLRVRRLGQALVETFPFGKATSVAEWVRQPEARALRIAEINRIEGLHEALRPLPGLTSSDFAPGALPGSTIQGVRSEDLMRLTYPDAAFDVVLTSETLEHVPDLETALREIRRVLIPGGWHLFTVPLLPHVPRTFPRAVLGQDGAVNHLYPPIHHPSGDTGYLVFTELGADLPDLLARAGFTTHMRFGPVTEHDLGQVFATQKTLAAHDTPTTQR
ncbi:MAG: class I SAM-dependent methyltransferase [Isosphaeraceae bacterium]|nr:class I SAM-dependent methyltransferase [Isosphaeraceae bacterium]